MNVATVDLTTTGADAAFERTLRETGFAVLRNAPPDALLIAAMQAAWMPFFEQPAGIKQAYRHDRPGQAPLCGYWSTEESETAVGAATQDLKEFFHVLPGAWLPPGVGRVTYRYREVALALGRRLLGAVHDGVFADLLSGADSVLRIVYYPPLTGDEPPGAVRAAAHEDINLLTILPVADAPGLELKTAEGGWQPVDGRPGDIIVNAGDMLAEATDGRYPSTTHRVVNPDRPETGRLAMPLFLTPVLETVLSPRYTAGAYLEERLKAISGGNQWPPASRH